MSSNKKNSKFMAFISAALFVMALFNLIPMICNIAQVTLPEAYYIVSGITALICVGVILYSSVKIYIESLK